jgi:hypothetical protein
MSRTHDPIRTAVKAVVQGFARVVLIVGGTFQMLSRYVAAAGADALLYFDVPSELELIRPLEGVIKFPLAGGETVGTLAANGCPPRVKEFFRSRPGVDLTNGLAQLRAVGALAAHKLLADPTFERKLLAEVFDLLFAKHNGLLEQVEICVLTSSAGGTGGPVGPAVAHKLARLFRERSEAVVHIKYLRAGSLSFVGLGERIHSNAAATLAEDVQDVISPDRDVREVRSLQLLEVPMVGPRKRQRDAYVVQLTQALLARGVQEELNRCAPNQAFDSTLGTVSIVQPSWWNALPDRRVATEVVARFIPAVELVRKAGPRPGLVEGIKVVFDDARVRVPASLEEVVSLLRHAHGVQPPGFWTTCTELSFHCTCATVYAAVCGTSALDLSEKLRALGAAPCRTAAEMSTKLSTLRSIDVALERELEERSHTSALLHRKRDRAHAELRKVLKRSFPSGVFEHLLAGLANPNTLLVRFKNAVTRAREEGAKLARVEAEIQALRGVRGQLAAELEAMARRLNRVLEVLAALRPGQEAAGPPLVEVAGLDSVLEELLRLADQEGADSEDLLRLLGSCAARVTRAGLAEITGAAEPRAWSIADRLARCTPPTPGPVWGGKKQLGKGSAIVVLPPLTRETEEELRTVLHTLAPEMVLACADTAQGGVNVIRLEILKPRNAEEIFTPFIQQHLGRALAEQDIFFTNGFDTGPLAELLPRPPEGPAGRPCPDKVHARV